MIVTLPMEMDVHLLVQLKQDMLATQEQHMVLLGKQKVEVFVMKYVEMAKV